MESQSKFRGVNEFNIALNNAFDAMERADQRLHRVALFVEINQNLQAIASHTDWMLTQDDVPFTRKLFREEWERQSLYVDMLFSKTEALLAFTHEHFSSLAPTAEIFLQEFKVSLTRMRVATRVLRLEVSEQDSVSPEEYKERIQNLVPPQEPAPFQFEFNESGLNVISIEPSHQIRGDQARYAAAQREYLLEHAQRIADFFSRNNASPNLKAAFASILQKIGDEKKILLLGQEFWNAQSIFKAEEPTLLEAFAADLNTHLLGIERYLNRFPDWKNFLKDAEGSSISTEEDELVSAAVETAADYLDGIPTVDPDVPASLREVARWPLSPYGSIQGRMVARLRIFVNLVKSWLFGISRLALGEYQKQISQAIAKLLIDKTYVALGAIEQYPWLNSSIQFAVSFLRAHGLNF